MPAGDNDMFTVTVRNDRGLLYQATLTLKGAWSSESGLTRH